MENRLSTICVLTPSPVNLGEQFQSAFTRVLGRPSNELEYIFFHGPEEFKDYYVRNSSVLVCVIDGEAYSSKEIRSLVRGASKLDSGLCSLLVTGQTLPATELKDLMDDGLTATLRSGFKAADVQDGLKEILAKRLTMHRQRAPRVPTRLHLVVKIASLEQGLAAETLDISVGGFFVGTVLEGAEMGRDLSFEFVLSPRVSDSNEGQTNPIDKSDDAAGARPLIQGAGRIVWVRRTQGVMGPAGMGVEFTTLETASKRLIEDFVTRRRLGHFQSP